MQQYHRGTSQGMRAENFRCSRGSDLSSSHTSTSGSGRCQASPMPLSTEEMMTGVVPTVSTLAGATLMAYHILSMSAALEKISVAQGALPSTCGFFTVHRLLLPGPPAPSGRSNLASQGDPVRSLASPTMMKRPVAHHQACRQILAQSSRPPIPSTIVDDRHSPGVVTCQPPFLISELGISSSL